MKRSSIREVLEKTEAGSSVLVQGWLRTRRDSKEFSFLEVNDGSCFSSIQVVADASLPGYQEQVLGSATGAALEIHGELTESPAKGQRVEIKATQVEMIGESDSESYPLQKKRHSNEFLRTIAHLRPRTNTFGAVFRVRSAASFAVHQFFQERGFFYVHTPIITGSDCEGAGELFRVTTLDLANVSRKEDGSVNYQEDFFGTDVKLTVSGQLPVENFACSLSRVYTFGPTFRAENSNTPRHLAEFWMIEPEAAFCDLSGNAALAEEFVRYVVDYVLEHCPDDMAFFDRWIEKGIIESLAAVKEASFAQMSYSEAISVLEKSNKKFEFPVEWGQALQTEHERYLAEEYVGSPLVVTNYPKSIKPFYMRVDEGEKTVAAMDVLLPRIGELIGGSQREERMDVLKARMMECGVEEEELWWYLDLRRYGSVPHSGFGLGFERLIMYLTGMSNVRDVIPFPRTPGSAEF